MIINVDKEARVLINQLCDVALKSDGLANLKGVTTLLNTMKDIVPIEKKKKK